MAKNDVKKNSGATAMVSEISNFALVEAFKAIRTNLSFAIPGNKKCKKLLITSSLPSEGKTTVSSNTAITIAQTEAKVLLIDADLRKPKVHTRFGIENSVGLSNVLSGMAKYQDAIRPSGKGNLFVMTAGVIPPNPAELLSSEAMRTLLTELEESFDYVIVDSAPINLVADALELSAMVDGVALVVKANSSTHPATRETLARLEFVGANVVGIILNDVVTKGSGYYKKKGYKYSRYGGKYGYSSYGYGYGYGYGHTPKPQENNNENK
ncbi:MAG: CpsD/CapB family tyrosine-protein kinase [Clostridia bacterium]|nr:CpsD/CapB family tyrosine-protein kinase [Clostridia bacterium]